MLLKTLCSCPISSALMPNKITNIGLYSTASKSHRSRIFCSNQEIPRFHFSYLTSHCIFWTIKHCLINVLWDWYYVSIIWHWYNRNLWFGLPSLAIYRDKLPLRFRNFGRVRDDCACVSIVSWETSEGNQGLAIAAARRISQSEILK